MDREAVCQEAARLVSQGWFLLPCDTPEQGAQGFVAFREVAGEEETKFLQWYLFGKPLDTDSLVVEGPELLSFISESRELHLCDDPRKLLIGFVRYESGRGRAVIRRIQISKLKVLAEEDRQRVLAVRKDLLEAQQETQNRRIGEVTAIQAAANA
jgi:hypothetical protein